MAYYIKYSRQKVIIVQHCTIDIYRSIIYDVWYTTYSYYGITPAQQVYRL